ncbi:hypothetical protein [Leuconostoc citreum]|uniref:hypothetical protein n=1 Tax=Leuconostoc citreum TaxID=33964 RepID=UPI0032DFBEC6
MTFDEALELVDDNVDYSDDHAFYRWYDLLEKLSEEYAPTVEMTKSEKNNILSSRKYGLSFINFYVDVMHQSTAIKFGAQTTPELYKSLSEEKLMRAWLHPKTIEVVEEK